MSIIILLTLWIRKTLETVSDFEERFKDLQGITGKYYPPEQLSEGVTTYDTDDFIY